MGCGSSQSTNVIRSAKVAPMDDAPTDPPPMSTNGGCDSLRSTSTTSTTPSETQKKFMTRTETSVDGKKAPSPTPSRKSMKSVSSKRAGSGLTSSKKHSGSNRSLVSLRAEDKRKRDQLAMQGSTSSLIHKQQDNNDRENGSTSTNNKRQHSTSKTSIHTDDSGLGGGAGTGSTVKIITPPADERTVTGTADEDRPATPELCIDGMAITPRKPSSASRRHNQLSAEPLETPDRDTSIIQRPPSRGGMAFDIITTTPDTGNVRRAPSRLRELKRTPSQDKNQMSAEKLKDKLQAAEKRRLQYEKENVISKTESKKKRLDQVHNALEEFASRQSMQTQGRMLEEQDKKAGNREAQLKALRERLKAKEDHARKVREAKQALASSNA
ncbi:uncharacterized protein LOC135815487 [Sycon ciliatum]|uniref:uncharacterized protein LOC135815487 n=1 Tax=Sycon ciliatum TaxID=27933 RepID=UPI0031F627B6